MEKHIGMFFISRDRLFKIEDKWDDRGMTKYSVRVIMFDYGKSMAFDFNTKLDRHDAWSDSSVGFQEIKTTGLNEYIRNIFIKEIKQWNLN